MSSVGRIQELLDKATKIAEEVQEVKVEEKRKNWREQDIQEHLRTMDRNSSHFVLWLSWLRETKNFDAEKIINRLLELGANPSDIKAVFQDDTRYNNRLPLT